MDVGVQISQYKIVEHIGRGGMADVWSARDTRLNRMVAIKTIAHGLSQDVDPINMFKQEAQTIAQMEHPHILPIYDFGEYNGQLYIVMRFVAGGSLEDMLRRGPMELEDGLRMARAIAEALNYAHANKVIHLDLKPPNVLLDSYQSPYLADFGLATVLDIEGKAMNPGSGTLLYMAPEQLTAEMIDHRADVYSFCIMLFHILTGQLPFQASIPLALKQMQPGGGELPDVAQVNPALPSFLNDILRRGTSIDVETRQSTIMDVIKEINERLSASTGLLMSVGRQSGEFDLPDYAMLASLSENADGITDMEVLEALDIYTRARHAWAGGNGRFLLGLTHYMIMSGYYMIPDFYGLELDEAGTQMLLRGALEFDQEIDFWWNKLDDENRRWVCLHTIRSGTAPARVRALYRIETLPDGEKPQIPKLVAQALQVETNEEARLAALQVLGTRARLVKRERQYEIKTEYRGRMLTTLTRLDVQVSPPSDWQEAVYSPEIDLLIAECALDQSMPRVSEFAARIIGRMRSVTAVRALANAQKAGQYGALRALALVRDEAPSLPPVVGSGGRFYAWMANTWRRVTDRPLQIVWRYLFALIGGWLAMGYHVNQTYRQQGIFTQDRWANTVSMGLVFGVIVGFVTIFGDEIPTRLRRFWPWWGRVVLGLVVATLFGGAAWYAWLWFYLKLDPGYQAVLWGGLGLALGFVLTSLFRLKSFVSIAITAALSYIPIYVTHLVGQWYETVGPFRYGYPARGPFEISEALLYYIRLLDDGTQARSIRIFTIAVPFVLLIAVGGNFQGLIGSILTLLSRYPLFRRKSVEDRRMMTQPLPVLRSVPVKEAAMGMSAANMATELDPQIEASIFASEADDEAPNGSYPGRDAAPPTTNLGIRADQRGAQPIPPPAPTTEPRSYEQETSVSVHHPVEEVDTAPQTTSAPATTTDSTEQKPRYANLNFGKGGMKLDIPNMNTELDPNKQRQQREDQEE
ncbi:MAG: serine/threonine-protein kinase [bacterium]|nr:serine/threonine-protein kinase [bacterium]